MISFSIDEICLEAYLEWLSRPTSVRLYEVVPIALLLAPLPFFGALLFLVARPPSPTPAAGGPVTLVGGQLALQVAEGPVVVVVSAPAKHPLMVNFGGGEGNQIFGGP